MKIQDVFFPWNLSCIICGSEWVDPHSGLCQDCADALPLPEGEQCEQCGRECDAPGLCADCMREPPSFDRAMAPYVYDGDLRLLLHGFKYNNRRYLALPLARLMRQAMPETVEKECGFVACVPLHPSRKRQRGYNQSALLAKELSAMLNLPFREKLLRRVRRTTSQATLDRESRLKNVKNAFEAAEKLPQGAAVLLIDDIFTTGATVNDCARALKKVGAARVYVLTAAMGTRHM